MARLNTATAYSVKTHEGGPAFPHVTPEQRLRRSLLSCLLWEKEFYEDGESIADRIAKAAGECSAETVAALAIEARSRFNLRHAPLLLLTALAEKRGSPNIADAIRQTIQRADEMGEFLALYWRKGKRPLSRSIKTGLALAFAKFDAYQLAKYDRDGAVKLRDVLRLVHPKPATDEQAALWKQVVARTLTPPDTWEVALSSGADKAETFARLLAEKNLGYLALLRNLRNMVTAGVDTAIIRDAILARKNGAHRVLPFRYVAAARACPQMEPALDQALSEAISALPPFSGKTAILVDVSGSMNDKLSAKSDLTRMDAAAALASIVHGDIRMFSFSNMLAEVPPRRGMAGIDALIRSQPHQGTRLGEAVAAINAQVPHDRLIVITDEQAADRVPDPKAKGYMINVASAQNGVGYGKWVHLDGFSERVLTFIGEHESANAR